MTNHLSVMIEAIGYEQTMKVKLALERAGYVIYKQGERTSTEGGMGKFTVHEWPEKGEGF